MIILSKSKKIAEGQIVTYNVKGRMLKYKKVNGKLKYIGVADSKDVKKKEPKEEKEEPKEELDDEQKSILKDVGIKCKDKNAAKYVKEQMEIFLKAHRSEGTTDDRNIPQYIKNLKFLSSNIMKYTPNKVEPAIGELLLQEDYVNWKDDLPKMIRDIIKPLEDYKRKTRPAPGAVKEQNSLLARINMTERNILESGFKGDDWIVSKDILTKILKDAKMSSYSLKMSNEIGGAMNMSMLMKDRFLKAVEEHNKHSTEVPGEELVEAINKAFNEQLVPLHKQYGELLKDNFNNPYMKQTYYHHKIQEKNSEILKELEKLPGVLELFTSDLNTIDDDYGRSYLFSIEGASGIPGLTYFTEKGKSLIDRSEERIQELKDRIKKNPNQSYLVKELEREERSLKFFSSDEYKDFLEKIKNSKEIKKLIKEKDELYNMRDKIHEERTKGEEFQLKKELAKKIKQMAKTSPQTEEWFRAMYVSSKLNTTLLAKQSKAIDKGEKPVVFTPKEALGIKTDADVQREFTKKRAQSYKSESLRKKLLGEFSDKGDEKKIFSLKTASVEEKKIIKNKIITTFDNLHSKSFGFKVHDAFQIGETSYYKDFKKLEKELGNVRFTYHGTSFDSAAKIARGGFKVTRPKVGRMLGDGIYGASASSKSLQYIGSGFTRGPGTRGVLFVCKNALGNMYVSDGSDFGERDKCNQILKNYDTIMAKKGSKYGSGVLANDEWNCKNPKAFMPVYWIDVELTSPNDKNNQLNS